ncbi:MAG: bile acid:sodium symporter family protein [Gammaproteobacteria bacterium]|nr:bile acid:sodium symporter family protein [Gammaproteobacteria bacterium]MXW46231.1 bile acid:sodium symporter family protein [Gammaproteobacteria bacterium]MYD00874.1 bile acid:sodium symporter family protein [Gammaproteobacteria bacterium]MYI24968.1 bile acid:sodium symporter family protein [Gammaproteobacteria bacterium]
MGFVTDVVLPLALAFIMLALGLGLTFDDFVRVARRPRDFAVGAMSQIIVLPAVAFFLASVWPMAPELALGMMIIAAAPGGVTSNLLTSFARGDVALSISLTAVISLLSVITVPLVVVFAYGHFIGEQAMQDVTVADTAISVFLIVTVPVVIGLLVRRYAERIALRIEPTARTVSAVLFVLVLAGAIYQELDNLADYYAQAGLATLALNLLMMVIAYLLARWLATGAKQRTAIAIECGLQNGTLAIAIAVLLFGGGLATVPAATYSLTMFATALIYVAILRRTQVKGD